MSQSVSVSTKKRILLITALSGALAGVLIAALLFLSKGSPLDLEQTLFTRFIKPHLKNLPVEVETFQMDTSWRDFFSARIKNLTIHLVARQNKKARIELSGPVEILRKNGIALQYRPELRFLYNQQASSPLSPQLDLVLSSDFSNLSVFYLNLPTTSFEWKAVGLKAESLETHLSWDVFEEENPFQISVQSHKFEWQNPKSPNTQMASLSSFNLQGSGSPPDAITYELKLGSSEVLWNDQYYDPDFSSLPLLGSFEQNPSQNLTTLEVSNSSLGKITAHLLPDAFKLDTSSLQMKSLIPIFRSFFPKDFQFNSGRLKLSANFDWNLKNNQTHLVLSKLDFGLNDLGLNFKNLDLKSEIKNLNSHALPEIEGSLTAPSIFFKRLKLALAKTPFKFDSKKIEIGESNHKIPLSFLSGIKLAENQNFEIGKISGELNPHPNTDPEIKFEFITSLRIENLPFSQVQKSFCLDPDHPIPGSVSVQYPEILIYPNGIEPTGKIQAHLFDGTLTISDLALFRWLTPVPEVWLTADLKDVKLDELGMWSGFGEMDGKLKASVHDLVIQGALPTQFDFRIEVEKDKRRKVVFSPDAMKNFVSIIAGENPSDFLPGIAEWIAFGWPSRIFGGYDVYYAGISVFSADGRILLETLDPEEIVTKEQKHFILYGPRFKMPIRTRQYPVMVDASAMGNFVRRVARQISQLSPIKGDQGEINDESRNDCKPLE